jgi:hypothetical protein
MQDAHSPSIRFASTYCTQARVAACTSAAAADSEPHPALANQRAVREAGRIRRKKRKEEETQTASIGDGEDGVVRMLRRTMNERFSVCACACGCASKEGRARARQRKKEMVTRRKWNASVFGSPYWRPVPRLRGYVEMERAYK